MKFPPTPEQDAIIAAASRTDASLMVTAYAGCAKTSTIEMASESMPVVPTIALAFNKKIADELTTRLPEFMEVKTMNGLGHGAFGRAIGKKLNLDKMKLGKLVTQAIKDSGEQVLKEDWEIVLQVANRAMQWGLVPQEFHRPGLVDDEPWVWNEIAESLLNGAGPLHVELAQRVVVLNIKQALQGTISFDDQIYMSALFGGVFPRFNTAIVDEAQDLSPLNHAQLAKMQLNRLVVMGDPKQAIYAFRGADSRSMSSMRKLQTKWVDLTLKQTFRCPKAIVARHQDHAPGFLAAEGNKPGSVHAWGKDEWAWSKLMSEIVQGHDATVLCRNNAPLMGLAFKLIRNGIGVKVLGREIGKGLVSLARKLVKDETKPVSALIEAILAWEQNETVKLIAAGHEHRVDAIHDRAECVLAVAGDDAVKTVADYIAAVERMFTNENARVTLATGHKAKGLEWNNVIHLDYWRVPSPQAKRRAKEGDDSALEQEKNLRYVIETRTRDKLIEVDLGSMKGVL